MSDVFREAASAYEEIGLSPFPLIIDENGKKRPAVRNPQTFRPSTWRILDDSLLRSPGVGLWCGPRNNLTVVDFDTDDRSLVDDFLARAGDTQIKVQTASNRIHLWYRHSGERRSIRPIKGLAIDILGAGGFTIAPPTYSPAKRGCYEFLEGCLDDIAILPTIKPGALPDHIYRGSDQKTIEEMKDGDGRNQQLFREALRVCAAGCIESERQLYVTLQAHNERFREPLDMDEVSRVTVSAWQIQCEGRNRFGKEPHVEISVAAINVLRDQQDAMSLLILLRQWNFGLRQHFHIAITGANGGITRHLPWKCTKRTRAAILVLCERGLIEKISPPRGPGRPGIYAFKQTAAKGGEIRPLY